MEQTTNHSSLERAREAALAWLEKQAKELDRRLRMELGREEAAALSRGRERTIGEIHQKRTGVAAETGVRYGSGAFVQEMRLDFDPSKGPHWNCSIGEGSNREKAAFAFPPPKDVIGRAVTSWAQCNAEERACAEDWMTRMINRRRV